MKLKELIIENKDWKNKEIFIHSIKNFLDKNYINYELMDSTSYSPTFLLGTYIITINKNQYELNNESGHIIASDNDIYNFIKKLIKNKKS